MEYPGHEGSGYYPRGNFYHFLIPKTRFSEFWGEEDKMGIPRNIV
jgi:hypothetical protein